MSNIELYTNRLRLRPIQEKDLASIISISVYDGKFARSTEEAFFMLQKIRLNMKKGNSIHWGIEFKDQEGIVGTCGFYRGFKNQQGEIGYIMKKNWRRKGIMKEAIIGVLKYGFQDLNLEHIIAITEKDNKGSCGLLKKLHFKIDDKDDDSLFHRFCLEREIFYALTPK